MHHASLLESCVPVLIVTIVLVGEEEGAREERPGAAIWTGFGVVTTETAVLSGGGGGDGDGGSGGGEGWQVSAESP